jgi:ribosomal protein S27AE
MRFASVELLCKLRNAWFSTALLATLAIFWVVTLYRPVYIPIVLSDARGVLWLISGNGDFYGEFAWTNANSPIRFDHYNPPHPPPHIHVTRKPDPPRVLFVSSDLDRGQVVLWTRPVFIYWNRLDAVTPGGHAVYFGASYWLMISLLLLCVGWKYYHMARTRFFRLKHGLCEVCGYDLQSSRQYCPECGKKSENGTHLENETRIG